MSKIQKPSSEIELVERDSSTYDEIPFDSCKLPSKGVLYPENHPLHLQEVVEFKAMTAHEENILASPALLKAGTVLNVLIKSCLSNKSIDPLSLLVGDKAALLLMIRISGFTEEYRVKTYCPSCGKDHLFTFDLGKAELKPLGAEPCEKGKNLFEYKLPKSGAVVKFALATDGDDLEVMKIQENRKKVYENMLVDTTITDRMKLSIKEVNGKKDGAYISKFIQRMPALDARKFRAYVNKIEPDVIMKEEVTCVHCGSRNERSIPMGYEFFWPKTDE